jgi:hypothetical protein
MRRLQSYSPYERDATAHNPIKWVMWALFQEENPL